MLLVQRYNKNNKNTTENCAQDITYNKKENMSCLRYILLELNSYSISKYCSLETKNYVGKMLYKLGVKGTQAEDVKNLD